jgi:regulation of enolase protein 1 (concanavalin A-like superfamily)
MTSVTGDYVAQTRVEAGERSNILAGLLLWRDEQNFIRLELETHTSERLVVHLDACVAGRYWGVGWGPCPRRPLWLRLERDGEEIRGLCSVDGENWLTCGSLQLPVGEREQIGLSAIRRDRGAHAWFDSFEVWRGAIAPANAGGAGDEARIAR